MKAEYSKEMFVGKSNDYRTPRELFDPLNDEFRFEIDLFASHENHMLPVYYTKEDDAFTKQWDKPSWINPEFVNVKKVAPIAYRESNKHNVPIVMLCMAKSNTKWWRDYVMRAKEVMNIYQKIQFEGTVQGLRFPATVVVFQPHDAPTIHSTIVLNKETNRYERWKYTQ